VKRFVEGRDRAQFMLLPKCLDDFVGEDNPVRVVDAFIEELDLAVLGFAGVVPEATGRPSYHPATLLKIYLYGYLNQVQSSRRLERETRRNLEVMWLTGRLTPDFQDHRRLSSRQRFGDKGGVQPVCYTVPSSGPSHPRRRRHRR
jgi:transposase